MIIKVLDSTLVLHLTKATCANFTTENSLVRRPQWEEQSSQKQRLEFAILFSFFFFFVFMLLCSKTYSALDIQYRHTINKESLFFRNCLNVNLSLKYALWSFSILWYNVLFYTSMTSLHTFFIAARLVLHGLFHAYYATGVIYIAIELCQVWGLFAYIICCTMLIDELIIYLRNNLIIVTLYIKWTRRFKNICAFLI